MVGDTYLSRASSYLTLGGTAASDDSQLGTGDLGVCNLLSAGQNSLSPRVAGNPGREEMVGRTRALRHRALKGERGKRRDVRCQIPGSVCAGA